MDCEVYGFDLREGQDLRNYEQVRNVLDKVRPDYIYHLAAQAFVGESFKDPHRAFEVNTIGSLNILEAVKNLGLNTKILLAGTSEEYGDGNVTEEAMLKPASPYAISKAAMDQLGQLYAKSYGLNVVVTRAFNHTGAGRGEMYAESSWAKQIVEIERGQRHTLYHGNLDTIRNYTDVRDIVKAYKLAIEQPGHVFNICSDQNVEMERVLNILCDLSNEVINTRTDKNLLRPFDFSFKRPECPELQRYTGWEPTISLEETLQSILTYWREK